MRWMLAFLLLFISFNTYAEKKVNESELRSLGEQVKYWPILDARALSERSQRPIAGAQQIDDELKFDVGDTILIVGDDEDSAAKTAISIEKQFPSNSAVVVEGGYETLRSLHGKKIKSLKDNYFPDVFTIPSDTCESGPPLHMFDDSEEQ